MTRETSIDAYQEIADNGLLSARRLEVYKALYDHGPCTAAEMLSSMSMGSSAPNQIRARLNELRSLGVAREVGTRPCRITGMRVIVWDVTSNLPVGVPARTPCPYCGARRRPNP